MLKKHFREVAEEKVTLAHSVGVTIRWLLSKQDGAQRFAMRRFVIQPGGRIGLHSHPEEHEIYVLSGAARIFDDAGFETVAVSGDAVFVSPHERHGYENAGSEPFVFLCVIPLLEPPSP